MENHIITERIDPDVLRVIDFMQYGSGSQRGIAPSKLACVAEAVGKLAPLLWGHQPREEFYEGSPITIGRSLTPSVLGGDDKLPQNGAI